MNETDRRERNTAMLSECWPAFGVRLRAILADMEGMGFRPRVQCAWRSPADQMAAFLSGHSKLKWGYHNATGKNREKEALAADVLDDDVPLAPSAEYLVALSRCADSHNCDTGILWGLPPNVAFATRKAVMYGITDPIKIGWDPTHVQASGVTSSQAKAGARPA